MSFAETILTSSWTITLDETFWYLGEVQRALTGTGRDCALSASCSLQRLWISLSRSTFSLPKSWIRCSGITKSCLTYIEIFTKENHILVLNHVKCCLSFKRTKPCQYYQWFKNRTFNLLCEYPRQVFSLIVHYREGAKFPLKIYM